jgi:hypothetical protein
MAEAREMTAIVIAAPLRVNRVVPHWMPRCGGRDHHRTDKAVPFAFIDCAV